MRPPFLDVIGEEAKVEALLSIWKIDSGGKLIKDRETSFSYDSLYQPSKNGKMKL